MKRVDPILLGIIALMFISIAGIVMASVVSQQDAIPQYLPDDPDRAKLSIGETQFDFGKMRIVDVKTQEIPIKNAGNKPLILSDFITSCDCTFAQVIINGEASPKFSMHRNPKWRGAIAPGAEAVIKIIYEPKVMPIKGKVNRQIIFKSNDPKNDLITLSFNAEVE